MAEILVVDDEKSILEALKYLFENRYQSTFCSSGYEALDIITTKNFDIALLDLCLGDMSGNEILRKIKEKNNSANVVMMSAYKTKEFIFDAGKFGAEDYIFKPFDNDELLNLIESIIERRMLNEKESKVENLGEKSEALNIPTDSFTSVEISMMKLLCEGKLNKEIASILNIKESSIKNRLHVIFKKLKIRNRVEAVNKIKGFSKT